jgi:alpha/beta superfamily hydrolase
MHNPVVLAAVRACLDAGWIALRFNFGGVGTSGGGFSGGPEEVRDVSRAAAALRPELSPGSPLAIVGYSFGAWAGARAACDVGDVSRVIAVAPPLGFFDWAFVGDLHVPLAVIVGDRDQYCPQDRVRALAAATGADITTIPGADHFFAGRDDDVAAAIRRRL